MDRTGHGNLFQRNPLRMIFSDRDFQVDFKIVVLPIFHSTTRSIRAAFHSRW